MRNAAERMRHPSMSYNEEMKAVIEWIVEPK
jgi:hypothetical protein